MTMTNMRKILVYGASVVAGIGYSLCLWSLFGTDVPNTEMGGVWIAVTVVAIFTAVGASSTERIASGE